MSQPENETVSAPQPPAPAAPAAPVVIKSGGRGVGLFALVLAVLGLGASGFLFVQGQNLLKRQEMQFDQKISQAALGESQNAALLADNSRRLQSSESDIKQLQSDMQAQQAEAAAGSRALQELLKTRSDWVVDEAEAALNLAGQQLMIADNVPAAVAVLEGLDARLARFEQPQLLPLKQAVSSDLAKLKQRPFTDTANAALRLSRLEAAVGGLPLLADSSLRPPQAAAPAAAAPNAPWWRNAWNRTVSGLKGMVEIRHLNSTDALLMSPEQAFYVRENLRLHLLSARVALMQRQNDIYQNDLAASENAVRQYFDATTPAAQSWLREIAQLKTLQPGAGNVGDSLAASLKAVADYRQLRQGESVTQPEIGAASEAAASQPAAPAQTPPVSAPATPAASVPAAPAPAQASAVHRGIES
ncbi:uroporphyrinogen-III C-methyltransferase [Eikenella sp. S3360]|uniref:Uroporphyrinogen-III C-methyltransferase n=1 Tax=Eikenella glucosivorans TaxID=2766967 RepID=A0ABS0NCY6_9NEIS|nr:uroporphyrinogen-III C-methyltransferase [Eikenella glucosivorans]MBH5330114.1 uroporphyrinogen-III C-methyltransferase [Eikenella glucosivorans]